MSEKLGIAGSGTIACGLAVVAGGTGHDTVLRARSAGSAANAQKLIEKQCGRLDNTEEALRHITVTTELNELAECSFVVEAVAEEMDVKAPLLKEIAGLIADDAMLASTTSSLSVQDLAEHAGLHDRFVGFHVFNPVPVMKLIEIVYPTEASEDTKGRARTFCASIGKVGVEVPDTPGFVVNRLLFPYLFDAAKFQAESGLSPEDVDTCMKLGAGLPMGPLALLDYVGMDVSIAIGEQIGVEIPQNCRDLLEAGHLGKKTGKGFFDYN